MSIAIQFDHVSRKFNLNEQRPRSFQEVFLGLFHKQEKQPLRLFWALRDINFQVPVGGTVGLVGSNGAGKSTLLKLIAGIIPPTTGRIEINGRVRALLELGAGFHGDLSGRENIFLNGAILGLRRAEIRQKMDDIIAFAELERFIDVPVRHYSSGMYLRLGFSVAIHTNPDILIVDEALAVGDQAFQKKCIQRINYLKNQGVTIIFVSHSIELVSRICHSAIWLEGGELQVSGPIEQVGDAYRNYLSKKRDHNQAESSLKNEAQRWGSGEAKIVGLEFLDNADQPGHIFASGSKMTVRMHYQAETPIEQPCFGLAFYQAETGIHLSGPNSQVAGYDIPRIEGEGYIDFLMPSLPLLPDEYLVSAAIYDHKLEHPFDHRHHMGFFMVKPGEDKVDLGLFHIPAQWSNGAPHDQ